MCTLTMSSFKYCIWEWGLETCEEYVKFEWNWINVQQEAWFFLTESYLELHLILGHKILYLCNAGGYMYSQPARNGFITRNDYISRTE